MRALRCVVAVLLSSCSLSLAQNPPSAQPRQIEFVQMQAAIPEPPTAFRGDGVWHLCYEIHLTNVSPSVWSLLDIQVSNENGAPLSEISGKGLDAVLYHPGSMPDAQPRVLNEIGPGEAVVAYMWIDIAQNAAMPRRLQHELTVRKDDETRNIAVQSISTAVLNDLPQISSPLRGKNWVAGSAPSNSSPHRRTIIIYEGKPYIAQRYAIDWVQFGDNNQTYRGDSKDNHSYYCFGHEAYAVADATVVEVKDGIPENTPNEKAAVPINFDTVAGNHVNLDLGGGVYAMYAHLQPGSIRVKVGDHVTTGQVLGLVGNTGNSSEPHLHFQLMSAKSPLGGEGLPYTFATFYQVGKMTKQPPDAVLERTQPIEHHGEIPLENAIVNFEP